MKPDKAGPEQGEMVNQLRDKQGKWTPGQSGNPAGRKSGTGEVARLRAAIRDHIPEVIESMVVSAKEGDSQAARLLLERVIPALKTVEVPVGLPLDARDLMTSGRSIFDAIGGGDVTPEQGRELLNGLVALSKVRELDELAVRIEALEERANR